MSTEQAQKAENPSKDLLQTLFGFMHSKPKLTWKEDEFDAGNWEGEGDKLFVMLQPHKDKKVKAHLVKKANAKFAEVAKMTRRVHGIRLKKTVPVQIKQPTKKSGLHIYDARIRGLDHITTHGGFLFYQVTAQNADEAKQKITDLIFEARVQHIAFILNRLSLYIKKSPEDTIMIALNNLAKANEIDFDSRKPVQLPNGCTRVHL